MTEKARGLQLRLTKNTIMVLRPKYHLEARTSEYACRAGEARNYPNVALIRWQNVVR